MKINFESGYSSLITIAMMVIIIAVATFGFIILSSEFNTQYARAGNDSVNNTGILTNGTTAHGVASQTSDWIGAFLPNLVFLLMGIILVVVLLIVWVIVS